LGDGAHLGVHVFGQLKNVFGIGTAKIVGLVKNFHPHGAVRGILRGLLLGCGCHALTPVFRAVAMLSNAVALSSLPALRSEFRSVRAFSLPVRESLPVLCAGGPSHG